ncbi:MAG: AAA family ATPase [Deltaproteobacteria bacterium]|nr:AAA family ATPase [Deltaproteobacteria bacterium]
MERSFLFPPFHLDVRGQRLWRGTVMVPLRRKTLAVLCYLVEHPRRLVTREELFAAVWPDTHVSDGVLSLSIRELRQALGDDAQRPQFIETIPRRGYRWIAPLTAQQRTRGWGLGTSPSSPQAPSLKSQVPSIVGRETELAQLQRWLDNALSGERQVVFVSGEPGIGKTTLVDAFLAQIGEEENQKAKGKNQKAKITTLQSPAPVFHFAIVGRGQCIEHYGPGEAYLPVLEALGRLCREAGSERYIKVLGQHAPTWLLQMPTLLGDAELEAVQRRVQGATRERMLREMAEAVEVLTAHIPLALVLEDLHWSDVSTLDLLTFLARRPEPARLLVIGTYRPVEALSVDHPLRAVTQELHLHHYCTELRLGFLTETEVAEYLTRRFPAQQFPTTLAQVIHRRTEGNPLFMVNVVDALVAQAVLVEEHGHWRVQGESAEVAVGVPDNIRQMIERQIERLSPGEQRALEAASVAGGEFAAMAVAAALGADVVAVEELCTELVRRNRFLRMLGESAWPDGTVTTRYAFIHTLYQEIVYERVATGWRQRLHRRIGERVEAAYGDHARELAAELALHFERGQDYRRAVQYLQYAGENAVRRSAYVEASNHLTKGLVLLATLPDTRERAQQEVTLQVSLGGILIATKGYTAPEVERIYTRARELCQQTGDTPHLFPALRGLWVFSIVRAEHQTAHELGQQLLRLAQSIRDPTLLVEAHQALGITLCFLGDMEAAQEHLEQGIALYDPQQYRALAFLYAQDSGVTCRAVAAWVLWFRGYPDQALARAEEALTLARQLSHSFSLGVALFYGATVWHHYDRHEQTTSQWAEETVTLSTEQGFPFWLAGGIVLRGAELAHQRQSEAGIEQIRQGLAAFRATGAEIFRPYFLALLAEAYGVAGQAEEGLAVLTEALEAVDKTGERFYEAELYRLKGDLLLQQADQKAKITNP